jgi:hypothetical protein
MENRQDNSDFIAAIVWIIALVIITLLTSCVDRELPQPEPEPEIIEYEITITKECFSCEIRYSLNSKVWVIDTYKQSDIRYFRAFSNDTIKVVLNNVKVGSVFYPTEGYLTIASADTVEEHSIGRLTKTYILD